MDSTFPATVTPQRVNIQATITKTVHNKWFQWAVIAFVAYLAWRYYVNPWLMSRKMKAPAVMMMPMSGTPATAQTGMPEKYTQYAAVSDKMMPAKKDDMLDGFSELDNPLAEYKK